MKARREELERVEEVGPRISQAILEFFAQPANRRWSRACKKAGVEMTAEKKQRSTQLAGLDLCADRYAADPYARRSEKAN